MKIRFTGLIHIYYFVVFLFIVSAVGYGAYYFWKQNIFNGGDAFSIQEANVRFDQIKREEKKTQIKDLLESMRVRSALKTVESLDREIHFLHSVAPIESHVELKSSLNELKKNLVTLDSLPRFSSAFLVFSNKVSDLGKVAKEDKWGFLKRTSRRLMAKVNLNKLQNPEFFRFDKISRLVGSIKSDIESINKAVGKRPLVGEGRNKVLVKLKTLNTELEIFDQYVVELKKTYSSLESFNGHYHAWIGKFSPEISLMRINLEKNSLNFFWGILALLGLTILAFVGGIFIYERAEKSVRRKLEIFSSRIIQDGLIPIESKIDVKFSNEFEKELENFREYLHKRLSFGIMIQDAMPFSTLLLDSNLNLLWANKLFYEHWNLSEHKSDIMVSWDYLSRFTNLEGDDPVLMALNQDVAGIYNIKINSVDGDDKESSVFEMYVRPASYAGQKRVMLFFYPLDNLQETLADQAKAIVEPIAKTLDTLESGQYTTSFEENIAKDFGTVGIEDILKKFKSHHQLLNRRKKDLDGEIEKTENILDEQFKLSSEFKMLLKSDEDVLSQSIGLFSKFKTSLIEITQMREELEDSYRQSIDMAQELLKENRGVLSDSERIIGIFKENRDAFESVIKMSDNLKSLREDADAFRIKAASSINHMFVKIKGHESSGIEKNLKRFKESFESFNPTLEKMGKALQSLSVGLSKMGMIIGESKTPGFEEHIQSLQKAGNFFKEETLGLNRIGEEFKRADDVMVDCLKEFYISFKGLQKNMSQMEQFVGRLDGIAKEHTVS